MSKSLIIVIIVLLSFITMLLFSSQWDMFVSSQRGTHQTYKPIQIVGSSTVYPFATVVAETFGRETHFPTPIIESTGTGGGFQVFCDGIGQTYPDIINASRPITESERTRCDQNGVTAITEVLIGYDGIIIAHAKQSEISNFTTQELFLSLAEMVPVDGQLTPNPYINWSDIAPHLPNKQIVIYGPPPTSGTRDSFIELVMVPGCHTFTQLISLPQTEQTIVCQRIREDGAFITAGENDNLIIQKLTNNPIAYGIFGFNFLAQNSDIIQAAQINGTLPDIESISSIAYPVARSLFFYVKEAHIGVIPGLEQYITEFLHDRASGQNGYLVEKGLIPLSDEQRIPIITRVEQIF